MTNILDNILNNLQALPDSKDINIAKRFICNRQIRDLKDLVDSAVIKYKNKNKITEEEHYYDDPTLGQLTKLKSYVDSYYSAQAYDDEEDFFSEDNDLTECEYEC